MAQTIARVSGVALRPGCSRNNRYYSPEMIKSAVAAAQERISKGDEPMTMRVCHDSEDDSEKIVGRLTAITLGDDGSAMYEAELADTPAARTILSLIDTEEGDPFLRGVSIRGFWAGEPRTVEMAGKTVVTCDQMELDGLDFTASPGVPGARVDTVTRTTASGASPAESGRGGRYRIVESVQARVAVSEDATAEAETAETVASGLHRFVDGWCIECR